MAHVKPQLTLYSYWIPDNTSQEKQSTSPLILIAGDEEIYTMFKAQFPQYKVSKWWKPKAVSQKMYDYAFFVYGAVEDDRERFESWLDEYSVICPMSLNSSLLDNVYALSWHGGKIYPLVRTAKPYGDEKITNNTYSAAGKLAQIMYDNLDCIDNTDYFVPVPCMNKDFDLPTHLTDLICNKGSFNNGSQYVLQVKNKQYAQKDLTDIHKKQLNVKDLFGIKD